MNLSNRQDMEFDINPEWSKTMKQIILIAMAITFLFAGVCSADQWELLSGGKVVKINSRGWVTKHMPTASNSRNVDLIESDGKIYILMQDGKVQVFNQSGQVQKSYFALRPNWCCQ